MVHRLDDDLVREHVELLLHLALHVLAVRATPRMSARPALRTLLAIIFAASARSYRMPDSSPVASGCRRSCSMMKRSIVTTDVPYVEPRVTSCRERPHGRSKCKVAPARSFLQVANRAIHGSVRGAATQRSPPSSISSVRPSVRHTIEPSRSVRMHGRADRGERAQHARARMPVHVPGAHGDERDARPHAREKGLRAARVAPVMPDLEHVRAQRARRTRSRAAPPLPSPHRPSSSMRTAPYSASTTTLPAFGSLSPTIHAESGASTCSRTPSTTSESPGCTRRHATCSSRAAMQRGAIRRAGAGVRAVPVRGGMQRRDHARAAADVVRVRMREHEQRARLRRGAQVRDDGGASRIAAGPVAPRIEEQPATRAVCGARSRRPGPTSIMCSSIRPCRAGQSGRHAAIASAPTATHERASRRSAHARDEHRDARRTREHGGRERGRDGERGVRHARAHGGDAIERAQQRMAAHPRCSMPSARTGETATARKSAGCSTAMTGVARMFVIGATRLMRPKVHATSGALAMHATHDVSSVRASEPRMPVHDAGMHRLRERAARDERGHAEHAELIAEIEHGRGDHERSGGAERERRPRRRRPLHEAADRAHAEHHAGAHGGRGEPDHRDVRGGDHERRDARRGGAQSRHAAESSTAIAMIATCSPEIESMCTIPDTAKRSRTAGSTARSSAMRSARTSGASRAKERVDARADRRARDERADRARHRVEMCACASLSPRAVTNDRARDA